MSYQQQTSKPSDFMVDPARDGIANSLWDTVTGTPALSGATPNQFRFNASAAVVRSDLLHATVEFSVNFPLSGAQTPANLVDDISFGLRNQSLGNLGRIDVFVDSSADTITFRTYDDFGSLESTTLTWDTDWNGAQTIFRFAWHSNGGCALAVRADGDTEYTHLATHNTSIPTRSLNPYVTVVGGENFDLDFIAVKRALHSSLMLI